MDNELIETAKQFATKLSQLKDERRRLGQAGMTALSRLDPEMAEFANSLWENSDHAADWFTQEVQSLGWRTPWQCIAEGKRSHVMRILVSIAHGLPA